MDEYPTMEGVALDILFGIVSKIARVGTLGDGYLDLDHNDITIDLHVLLTDEEVDVMRRLKAHYRDGSREGE